MDDLGCVVLRTWNPTVGGFYVVGRVASFLCSHPFRSWCAPEFQCMFLLHGPDAKIINYSSAYSHAYLHWCLLSQRNTHMSAHSHTHTPFPEIDLLSHMVWLEIQWESLLSLSAGHMPSQMASLNIYSFGSSQLRTKYLWSRQHTMKLSSTILAGIPFCQGNFLLLVWLILNHSSSLVLFVPHFQGRTSFPIINPHYSLSFSLDEAIMFVIK